MTDIKCRCQWVTKDPIYIKYHDEEWGKPEFGKLSLFEMICLEGQQAGLSWLTVLKKRNNYRQCFYDFNPHKISSMTENDINKLVDTTGIIRHRGKIESIINNAKCYIEMEKNGEDFSNFVWGFVENKPIQNKWISNEEIPTETPTSVALSKALKKRGFKFVGATTCYAFMQACGLVNDHLVNCICYHKNIYDISDSSDEDTTIIDSDEDIQMAIIKDPLPDHSYTKFYN